MWPDTGLTSLLPVEMEARTSPVVGHDGAVPPRHPPRPQPPNFVSAPELPSRRARESSSSASNLRGDPRHDMHTQSSIRAVTPDPADGVHPVSDADSSALSQLSRGFESQSPQSSPRSITANRTGTFTVGGDGLSTFRRQGMVFNDTLASSLDSSSSSPPLRAASFRPRTHTLDGALRQQLAPAAESRHRVSSFSSAGSVAAHEDLIGPRLHSPFDSPVIPPVSQRSVSDVQTSPHATFKENRTSSRSRLVKRLSSRPASAFASPPPSVDSLPLPIPTTDANKLLMLMKTLGGKMNGEVEYQRDITDPWSFGVCYVDEARGSLMLDSGDMGHVHVPIVSDLRTCRVLPVNNRGDNTRCLEIASPQLGIKVLVRPLITDEFDLWLAALLSWQQLRPSDVKPANGRGNDPNSGRAEMKRRASSSGLRDAAIIKVGKVMLWDAGVSTTPRSPFKGSPTRHSRSMQGDWKRVSCILQDNGEFKLMTENDVTVLSVIELSQLARCAIQHVDRSVLDDEFCIGIFPVYSAASTHLSILRPVYVALDSRALFEVWFVLLRAFTVPRVYELHLFNSGEVSEVTDFSVEPSSNHFRVERTVTVRVTEAKLRHSPPDSGSYDRSVRPGHPALLGSYLAEVILDGEVRARTRTKTETKNPFWREDCEFLDVAPSIPFLTVVLKRVEGNSEKLNHQLHSSTGVSKTGSLVEVPCGSVGIALQHIERGKDHEQWHPIYDDRQQSIGTMLIKVHHEELVVLSAKEYQPLSELVHRFSAGLTAQVSEAVHGNSRRLAEVFLNIFQVSGKATEWLMNLVEDEIDGIGNQTAISKPRFSRRLKSNDSLESTSDREQTVRDMGKSLAGEANLLFRGNSLLTQALEFHMRRLGKEYLEEILFDKINEINDSNADCEVDPSRLQHGEDIQKNWAQLMQLIAEVWECIAKSANRLPPDLRHILKYIRAVSEDRYGDFLRTVTYTSVSGFLFLRFICPAVLNPKLFGLLSDHPRPRAQRTLTLIAKCLQALANLSTIGKKETWTQPMNYFINTQRQSLKDFIDEVCAIPMERNSLALPASYSTPITILGRLAPLSREGFLSLPYLIDHARNFAMLVKLWTDANPASSSPPSDAVAPAGSSTQVYDGDLLEFHSLCTAIQRRANECHVGIENLRLLGLAASSAGGGSTGTNRMSNQLSAAEADRLSELTDVFDHTSLLDAAVASSSPYGSSTAVWTDHEAGRSSTTLHPPGSSGSERDGPASSAAAFRDAGRFGAREPGGSRQPSGSSEWHLGGSPASTIRGLKNGKHARKLLNGFKRKGRTQSPDVVGQAERSSGKGTHGMSQEKEVDHNAEIERDVLKDRNKGLGLSPERRQMASSVSFPGRRQHKE